jgi:hypothetical protein
VAVLFSKSKILTSRGVTVTKSNGERESFNVLKLEHSLLNAGVSPSSAQKIIEVIQKDLVDGMTTAEIYSHAFYLLHKMEKPSAVRYSMRRSLTELGPSGFPPPQSLLDIGAGAGHAVREWLPPASPWTALEPNRYLRARLGRLAGVRGAVILVS